MSSWLGVSSTVPAAVLSLIPNLQECKRWVPSLRALRFHGEQSERERLKNEIRFGNLPFDICITTYECQWMLSYVKSFGKN
jgi:SNF2 family DNA or RNA helicase